MWLESHFPGHISGMCVSNHVYHIIQRMDVVNWLHGIHLTAFLVVVGGFRECGRAQASCWTQRSRIKSPNWLRHVFRETWEKKNRFGVADHGSLQFLQKIHSFPMLPPGSATENQPTEVGSAFDDKWPQASDQIRRTLSFSDQPGSGFRKPGLCHIQMVWDRL